MHSYVCYWKCSDCSSERYALESGRTAAISRRSTPLSVDRGLCCMNPHRLLTALTVISIIVIGTGVPANKDVEGGVRGAVGGILLEPLEWHALLTPRGWKRLTTEGHTFADAILTVAMAQIGEYLATLLTNRSNNAEASLHTCSKSDLRCHSMGSQSENVLQGKSCWSGLIRCTSQASQLV